MTIEDADKIDMICKTTSGGLELIAVDPGLTTKPKKRFDVLLRKLFGYVQYVVSDQFALDYPDIDLANVTFRVTCAKPPTAEMLEVGVMRHRDFPELKIDVEYEVIESRY